MNIIPEILGQLQDELPSVPSKMGDISSKRRPRNVHIPEWKVPRLPKLGNSRNHVNLLDKNTMYGRKHETRYAAILREKSMHSPLDTSPRLKCSPRDSQNVAEKAYVLWNHLITGKQSQFRQDRAIMPEVYKDALDSSSRKRKYVTKSYKDAAKLGSARTVRCRKHGRNHFCDVMGNKYCAVCIECKNRNFAAGLEKLFSHSMTIKNMQGKNAREVFLLPPIPDQ